MAPAFQNTLTFNLDIINYGRFSFLKLDNAVSLQPKKMTFSPFHDTKPIFAMKKAKHYDKQLTPSKAGIETFFKPGVWVSPNSNHRVGIFTTP